MSFAITSLRDGRSERSEGVTPLFVLAKLSARGGPASGWILRSLRELKLANSLSPPSLYYRPTDSSNLLLRRFACAQQPCPPLADKAFTTVGLIYAISFSSNFQTGNFFVIRIGNRFQLSSFFHEIIGKAVLLLDRSVIVLKLCWIVII